MQVHRLALLEAVCEAACAGVPARPHAVGHLQVEHAHEGRVVEAGVVAGRLHGRHHHGLPRRCALHLHALADVGRVVPQRVCAAAAARLLQVPFAEAQVFSTGAAMQQRCNSGSRTPRPAPAPLMRCTCTLRQVMRAWDPGASVRHMTDWGAIEATWKQCMLPCSRLACAHVLRLA